MSKPINISGSRAAAIIGLSEYRTPLNVWLEIMENKEPGFCEKNNYLYEPFEGNSSTRWGSAFESAIIELTEEKLNTKLTDREKYFQKDYLSCHVDAIIDGNILYEAKTTTQFSFSNSWGEPETDRIPSTYQIQVQHNLMLTGLDKCILSVLVFPKRVEEWEEMGYHAMHEESIGDMNICYFKDDKFQVRFEAIRWARVLAEMGYFHQYTIHAHADLQKLMLEAYADFWNNHVLTGTPPEPKNYDDIRAICRSPKGVIVSDEHLENLSAEYKNITKEISPAGTLAKRKEQIKTEILKKMIDIDKTVGTIIDDNAIDKFILMSRSGKKLFSYDGKVFR